MAGTVFKNIDKQRFKKIYPAKRHVPIVVKQSVKKHCYRNSQSGLSGIIINNNVNL